MNSRWVIAGWREGDGFGGLTVSVPHLGTVARQGTGSGASRNSNHGSGEVPPCSYSAGEYIPNAEVIRS